MTAVNIDGLHRVPIKRGNDKWFQDAAHPPRHPARARRTTPTRTSIAGTWCDARTRTGIRPCLSATPTAAVTQLARQANFDTFHYTNAAVQHGDFNSGSKPWLGLEDYILNSAKTHGFRASVFTGPVVRDDDDEIQRRRCRPREFWKVVVMENADTRQAPRDRVPAEPGRPHPRPPREAVGDEAVEGFVLGEYRTFQIAIADLADAPATTSRPTSRPTPRRHRRAGSGRRWRTAVPPARLRQPDRL